jgi:hypothetical protein
MAALKASYFVGFTAPTVVPTDLATRTPFLVRGEPNVNWGTIFGPWFGLPSATFALQVRAGRPDDR